MLLKVRIKEWFNRYKYAELAATTTVLIVSYFSRFFNGLTTAYLITFSEYFAFYGVIFYTSYFQVLKTNKLATTKTNLKDVIHIIKNIVIEFGYPAFLDILIVRPFCMYWLPILTKNTLTGIVSGKICADVVFYFLTIVNYEWMKRKNHF